jgi:hypothetical protein
VHRIDPDPVSFFPAGQGRGFGQDRHRALGSAVGEEAGFGDLSVYGRTVDDRAHLSGVFHGLDGVLVPRKQPVALTVMIRFQSSREVSMMSWPGKFRHCSPERSICRRP